MNRKLSYMYDVCPSEAGLTGFLLADIMISPSDMPQRQPKLNKKRLTFEKQAERLVTRGLELSSADKEELLAFLESNNYYRFSGYFCQFYENGAGEERFQPHVTLQDLFHIYELDCALSLLIFEGVQKIETLLRTKVAYYFSQGAHGATKYLRPSSYLPVDDRPDDMEQDAWEQKIAGQTKSRDDLLESIGQTLSRDEIYLRHHASRNIAPPLWVAVEALSLGDLSRMVSVWRDPREVSEVAQSLGFRGAPEFRRAGGNVSFFRNRVAHHARLFGYKLTRPVAQPPWPGSNPRPYQKVGSGTPIGILNLIACWVDHLEGDTVYSEAVWKLVSENYLYEEGMRFPRL